MTKAKLIAALTVAIVSLHASASFAAEETKASPSTSSVAPTPAKEEAGSSLFTRVNGTYRKSEKQLVPQT